MKPREWFLVSMVTIVLVTPAMAGEYMRTKEFQDNVHENVRPDLVWEVAFERDIKWQNDGSQGDR